MLRANKIIYAQVYLHYWKKLIRETEQNIVKYSQMRA